MYIHRHLLSIPGRQQKDIGNQLQAYCETWMSLVFSQLSHTESAEHQIFPTFEKYCVPCENKVHESSGVFLGQGKRKGGRAF